MDHFHRFIQDEPGWNIRSVASEYRSPYLEVHRLQLTSPTRSTPFHWTLCHRKGAVVVAPVTREGNLVLVRQERAPVRATIWEFPAGQIDDASLPEAIHETAVRELHEEAGYELLPEPDGTLTSLGYFFTSCGFTDEHSHLLLARSVVISERPAQPDANEAFTACAEFTPRQIADMIAAGDIRDANTLAAYARLTALRLLPS
jgi:ADP-ribose pyrophosphatase